jgi:hypothetical protein
VQNIKFPKEIMLETINSFLPSPESLNSKETQLTLQFYFQNLDPELIEKLKKVIGVMESTGELKKNIILYL